MDKVIVLEQETKKGKFSAAEKGNRKKAMEIGKKENWNTVSREVLFTELLVGDPFVADLGLADDGVADALQVGDVVGGTRADRGAGEQGTEQTLLQGQSVPGFVTESVGVEAPGPLRQRFDRLLRQLAQQVNLGKGK